MKNGTDYVIFPGLQRIKRRIFMKLGIIGGSGLEKLEGLECRRIHTADTPFGKPSDGIVEGVIGGATLYFLPRHGRGHTILPSEINHRANIYALKQLGVTHILSISAVGSLQEQYAPRDIVVIDQFYDRTKQSAAHTFFGGGIVAHLAFANPVCPELAELAAAVSEKAVAELPGNVKRPSVYRKGTYVNMEGPAFSTAAESRIYHQLGFDVIGMTNLGEAKLAREAEICYSSIAMVTDYDSWHPHNEFVTVNMIVENFAANVALAKRIIVHMAEAFSGIRRTCACGHALDGAVITHRDAIAPHLREKLDLIIGKYIK